MTSYSPPKKNAAFIMYVGLRSQSDTRLFQTNPTLASGDAKVIKDGGTPANFTNLPSVIASGPVVKLELTSTEMNADNITLVLSDAAGAQWCDLIINLQTVANQMDDLATASALTTVSGYIDTEVAAILAAVDTEVAAIKAKTDNLPSDPADDSDIDAQLAAIAGYLDTEVAAILAAVDTEVAAIKAKTDTIPASPAAVGSAMTLAADALTAAAIASDAGTEIGTAVWATATRALTDKAGFALGAAGLDAVEIDEWTPSGTEPATFAGMFRMVYSRLFRRNEQTSTTLKVYELGGSGVSGVIATQDLSDDATTQVIAEAEWSA